MNSSKIKNLAIKMVGYFPLKLQPILFKNMLKVSFLIFRISWKLRNHMNTPDPTRIYWISPERIIYHTNYLENGNEGKTPFYDRSFHDKRMRGQIVDGDWDLTNYRFTDLDVYDAFARRICEGAKWQDTKFYKRVLGQVESKEYVWGIKNADDLEKRFEYLDSLCKSIKNEGYRLSEENGLFDEIDVNIGRNGEYLFQNGVHRLSIAKILGIKYVPVMVFVRHKKWQEFREYVLLYAHQQKEGKLYQPIVHPDLADIPFTSQSQDIMVAIKHNLSKKTGTMLDIGSNIGFYCHKFEELGYQCYAIEQDPMIFQILERIRIAENRKFKAINESIFEVDIIRKMEIEVVLALNIFHHFLKSKILFDKFVKMLNDFHVKEIFFMPHLFNDPQMKGAYKNFDEKEFVDFILENSHLNSAKVIGRALDGRSLYKLY